MLPNVTLQTACDRPANSYQNIGFGPTDEFLLAERSGTIGKYTCSADSLLTTVWVKPLPQGMSYAGRMFITGTDGDIVLHSDYSTNIYTSDLVLKSQEDLATRGMFILAVTSNTLLYRPQNDGQYVVDIYNMSPYNKTVRLTPPAGRTWKSLLSACVVPGSGEVMVVDNRSKQLSMFSAAGTIIIYTQ